MSDLSDKLDFIRDQVVSDAKKTDTPPSILERLARAACDVATGGRMPDPDWHPFLSIADAILTELQEPSEGMQDAGTQVTYAHRNSWPSGACPEAMIFRAMIQHIRDGGS